MDTAYLKLIADAGNGSFLYVDSDAGLDNFYDFIHQQLTSQYVLKYRAKNLTMENRLLNISVKDELEAPKRFIISTIRSIPTDQTTLTFRMSLKIRISNSTVFRPNSCTAAQRIRP